MKCVLSTMKICIFDNIKGCLFNFTLLALAILTGDFKFTLVKPRVLGYVLSKIIHLYRLMHFYIRFNYH